MKLFISILLGVMLLSCSKIESDVPSCIKKEIRSFRSDARSQTASVDEVRYEEKLYYIFGEGNSVNDGSAAVYDSECNHLGFLGGFTGNTVIQGMEFSNAEHIRVVWRKNVFKK